MARSLVTVATDGFRDYVELPDGRTLNLGSVSVLKLITSLVPSSSMCKRALDTFLKDGRTVIEGDLGKLEKILAPKRARWAHIGKGLIPSLPRQGGDMTQDQASTVEASFDGLLSMFDSLYQTPTPETLTAFQKGASEFAALVLASVGDVSKESEMEKQASLSPEEWEKALKHDEDMLEQIRKDLKTLQSGGEVKNLTLDGAKGVEQGLEEVIKNKKNLLKKLKTASVETSGDSETMYKLAASEVPLVNEGLVHLVVAKVEAALKVVSSSSKKGSDLAKGDLHVISTRLDGIVKMASMEDPSLRSALLDLAGKADQVRSFFA